MSNSSDYLSEEIDINDDLLLEEDEPTTNLDEVIDQIKGENNE